MTRCCEAQSEASGTVARQVAIATSNSDAPGLDK